MLASRRYPWCSWPAHACGTTVIGRSAITVDGSPDMNTTTRSAYNYRVVRQFAIMTVVWGIVGMGLGVFIAAQLAWPELNLNLPWTSFGRLRPLHTNAVIFAFGGCALFATSYYAVQRTSQTPLFAPKLAAFTFWGWQLVILLAAISLPLGWTSSKEIGRASCRERV